MNNYVKVGLNGNYFNNVVIQTRQKRLFVCKMSSD